MRKRTVLLFGGIFLAGAAVLAAACSDEGDKIVVNGAGANQGISVSGSGSAFGTPDIANLQLGVQTEARTVAAAREAAARSQQALIGSLRANGIDDDDIQTIQFSIEPQYDFGPGVTQTLRAYRVTNVVNATIRKIDATGKIVDDAVAAGGSSVVVRGISFSIEDPTDLEEAAREEAMQQAEERAVSLAALAGVSLGRPLSIQENSSRQVAPIQLVGLGVASGLPTSIQAGQLQIQITVNVTYSIED